LNPYGMGVLEKPEKPAVYRRLQRGATSATA
jgi:hypothetical protein